MAGMKVVGILGAWLVMFALSGLWHSFIMADFYGSVLAGAARAQPSLIMVANGYLALAILMGWVYPLGYSGGPTWSEGARFGAVIGLVWTLPFSLVLSGLYELSLTEVAVDSAWHILEGAAGGVAIGLGYGRASGGPKAS